jgi:poly(A) polymerase
MDYTTLPGPKLNGPVILDRSRHSISRRDIDYDALKVLYRLTSHGFIAYLVGGAVRDLLLGRRPADFDVGTDAHPNQIKKLFRNAFLIGRRFRLAHVRFQGGKIIEVSTFRRKPDEEELRAEREEELRASEAALAGEDEPESPPGQIEVREPEPGLGPNPDQSGPPPQAEHSTVEGAPPGPPGPESDLEHRTPIPIPGRPPLRPIAFGTPQEDAFRRDITINALFYDISTYSVIDYVGGLDDLRHGRIRIIGDPEVSFKEDPVRIWRVIRHASRLNFTIEERTERAIPTHRHLLAKTAGSRLCEELNKDLKSGSSRAFFALARRMEILPIILSKMGELYQHSDEAFGRLTENLAALDAAIGRGASPGQDIMYSLLLWPWAKTVLADSEGDKPKVLYEAFRETRPPTQIPKGVLLDAVQTLAIVDHMLQALTTGQMRWVLKKRAHYPGASKICSLLVQGSFGEGDDPFERLYDCRFGSGRRPAGGRRRRRRPGRRKFPRAPAPEST